MLGLENRDGSTSPNALSDNVYYVNRRATLLDTQPASSGTLLGNVLNPGAHFSDVSEFPT